MVFGESKPGVITTDKTLVNVMVLDVATASVMTTAIATANVMALDLTTADVIAAYEITVVENVFWCCTT
jgi:hypothetical protein